MMIKLSVAFLFHFFFSLSANSLRVERWRIDEWCCVASLVNHAASILNWSARMEQKHTQLIHMFLFFLSSFCFFANAQMLFYCHVIHGKLFESEHFYIFFLLVFFFSMCITYCLSNIKSHDKFDIPYTSNRRNNSCNVWILCINGFV